MLTTENHRRYYSRKPFNISDKKKQREEEMRKLRSKGIVKPVEVAGRMGISIKLARIYLRKMKLEDIENERLTDITKDF